MAVRWPTRASCAITTKLVKVHFGPCPAQKDGSCPSILIRIVNLMIPHLEHIFCWSLTFFAPFYTRCGVYHQYFLSTWNQLKPITDATHKAYNRRLRPLILRTWLKTASTMPKYKPNYQLIKIFNALSGDSLMHKQTGAYKYFQTNTPMIL